jgi:hypothetical protein
MIRSPLGLALAAAAVTMAGPAGAAITLGYAPYGAGALPAGETTVVTFDAPNAAGYTGVSSGGAGTYLGSNGLWSGVAAPPATSPSTADQTLFEYVPTGGEYDLNTPLLKSLSVYIGSLDSYNLITFKGPGNFSQSFTGTQLALPANGDQGSSATNGRFDFNFGGQAIDEVVFQSSGNSFEFDNISTAGVPEPATWALMLLGVAGLGAALRRTRGSAAVSA